MPHIEALFRYGAKIEKGEPATMLDIIGAARKYYARVGREEGFRRSVEFMKSVGVSPENLEKFKAMYPDLRLDSETPCLEQD